MESEKNILSFNQEKLDTVLSGDLFSYSNEHQSKIECRCTRIFIADNPDLTIELISHSNRQFLISNGEEQIMTGTLEDLCESFADLRFGLKDKYGQHRAAVNVADLLSQNIKPLSPVPQNTNIEPLSKSLESFEEEYEALQTAMQSPTFDYETNSGKIVQVSFQELLLPNQPHIQLSRKDHDTFMISTNMGSHGRPFNLDHIVQTFGPKLKVSLKYGSVTFAVDLKTLHQRTSDGEDMQKQPATREKIELNDAILDDILLPQPPQTGEGRALLNKYMKDVMHLSPEGLYRLTKTLLRRPENQSVEQHSSLLLNLPEDPLRELIQRLLQRSIATMSFETLHKTGSTVNKSQTRSRAA